MTDPIVAAMRDVAGPHLFRRNAFRLTRVPTDADRRTVRHRRQKVTTLLQVGAETGLEAEPEEVTAAFDLILGDPRRRLVHELFWLWHTPNPTCSCTTTLHRDHDKAVRAYEKALKAESDSNWPGATERHRVDQLWTFAGKAWDQQMRRAAFWDHLRERITALDDRQLDESAIDTMRAELPVTLVRPLLQLAAHGGIRQADLSRLARDWPRTGDFVTGQLENAAEPLHEEIRTELRQITERLTGSGTPDVAAQQLRKSVLPKLDRLNGLAPADRHRSTARIRDEAATLFNNCAAKLIDSIGPAADKKARGWLGTADKLASDPQTRATIEQNRSTLADIVAAHQMIGAGGRLPINGNPDLDQIARILEQFGIDPDNPLPGRRPPVSYPPRRDLPVGRPAGRPAGRPGGRPGGRRVGTFITGLVTWGLIGTGIFWLLSRCANDNDRAGAESKVSVAAETIAGSAPPGTCITSREGWEKDITALPSVPCDQKHWGEILGYLPLAAPSPFPGDELLRQKSVSGCAFRLAGQGLTSSDWVSESAYTSREDWNTGQDKSENFISCLVHRIGDKPLPAYGVTDPGRATPATTTVTLSMFGADLSLNPPPGSCIADRASFDQNDGQATFIGCARPHWGEIIGYPVLYAAGSAWPGDDAVYATADGACRRLSTARKLSDRYHYHVTWPAQSAWTEDSKYPQYAVCTVSRTDEKLTAGALK